jgi:phospholipase/carboxylesterase
MGREGPDIAFIDRALAQTFNRYAIDPSKVAIAGFSDGASYALSVGLTNGDLFTHVIAFSPGFMAPGAQVGRARLFISHGKTDNVLPIDHCSRVIVPQLQHLLGMRCYTIRLTALIVFQRRSSPKPDDWFTASSPTES